MPWEGPQGQMSCKYPQLHYLSVLWEVHCATRAVSPQQTQASSLEGDLISYPLCVKWKHVNEMPWNYGAKEVCTLANISASSSVGIDLHLLDILAFALFVSDPPDPVPVFYILTLQTNLSFGRTDMFWQYILVYNLFIKANQLVARCKLVLNKTCYYHPHDLLIKDLLEGCPGCNSMQ